jgi:hypothetical protein
MVVNIAKENKGGGVSPPRQGDVPAKAGGKDNHTSFDFKSSCLFREQQQTNRIDLVIFKCIKWYMVTGESVWRDGSATDRKGREGQNGLNRRYDATAQMGQLASKVGDTTLWCRG